MDEIMEHIESYFENRCTPAERESFNIRCVQDESFCREVALYVTTRQVLSEELLRNKMAEWKSVSRPQENTNNGVREMITLWPAYAAAAAILLVIAGYFIFNTASPRQMAEAYVSKNLSQLSLTMGHSKDSLQKAISAFNSQQYTEAQVIFEALYTNDPQNTEALKYSGITYLATKDYDLAIKKFSELEKNSSVYSNPGPFYEAITLLIRNHPSDRGVAKQLLQKVVDEKLDGMEQAASILKKL